MTLLLSVRGGELGVTLLLGVSGRVVGCRSVTKCCVEGSWVWLCY